MNVAVVGGSGGIGSAFVEALSDRTDVRRLIATYNERPPTFSGDDRVEWMRLDATKEDDVRRWSERIEEIDWLINAVGMLHRRGYLPEKSIAQFSSEFFFENMTTNALPTLLLAKYCQRAFKHRRPAVFATVSAKLGSVSDNRLGGWVCYRASKAALNMCVRTTAIEWQRSLPNVAVAALHPGTVDTDLSRPFQSRIPRSRIFTPTYSVSRMLQVIAQLEPAVSGQFWAYDGQRLPW